MGLRDFFLGRRGEAARGPSMVAHKGADGGLSFAYWNPVAASADADLLPDLQSLTARSRDLNPNNGVMAGGQQTLGDNIVGSTQRLSTAPDYRLLGKSSGHSIGATSLKPSSAAGRTPPRSTPAAA